MFRFMGGESVLLKYAEVAAGPANKCVSGPSTSANGPRKTSLALVVVFVSPWGGIDLQSLLGARQYSQHSLYRVCGGVGSRSTEFWF